MASKPDMTDQDLFYNRMAAANDWDAIANTHETARRLKVVFEDLLSGVDLTGKSVLDGGSGGGHFSAEFVRRGAIVTSLDVGEALLAQVAKRCESTRVVGSLMDIPFADGTFDVVMSTEVIEHTPDPQRALRELARVVKPGGTLIVTTPGRLWQPVVRLASILKLRPYQGRENFLWPRRARQILEQNGIAIDRFFGFNLLPLFSPRFEPLLAATDRLGQDMPIAFVNFALRGTRR